MSDCPIECAPGCPPDWQGDGGCDSACNVAACNFDSSTSGGDSDCTAAPPPAPSSWTSAQVSAVAATQTQASTIQTYVNMITSHPTLATTYNNQCVSAAGHAADGYTAYLSYCPNMDLTKFSTVTDCSSLYQAYTSLGAALSACSWGAMPARPPSMASPPINPIPPSPPTGGLPASTLASCNTYVSTYSQYVSAITTTPALASTYNPACLGQASGIAAAFTAAATTCSADTSSIASATTCSALHDALATFCSALTTCNGRRLSDSDAAISPVLTVEEATNTALERERAKAEAKAAADAKYNALMKAQGKDAALATKKLVKEEAKAVKDAALAAKKLAGKKAAAAAVPLKKAPLKKAPLKKSTALVKPKKTAAKTKGVDEARRKLFGSTYHSAFSPTLDLMVASYPDVLVKGVHDPAVSSLLAHMNIMHYHDPANMLQISSGMLIGELPVHSAVSSEGYSQSSAAAAAFSSMQPCVAPMEEAAAQGRSTFTCPRVGVTPTHYQCPAIDAKKLFNFIIPNPCSPECHALGARPVTAPYAATNASIGCVVEAKNIEVLYRALGGTCDRTFEPFAGMMAIESGLGANWVPPGSCDAGCVFGIVFAVMFGLCAIVFVAFALLKGMAKPTPMTQELKVNDGASTPNSYPVLDSKGNAVELGVVGV